MSAGPMRDYRIDGPPEAQALIRDHRACETAPNGTGSHCLCDFDCANYWLRSRGYRADAATQPATTLAVIRPAAAPKRRLRLGALPSRWFR